MADYLFVSHEMLENWLMQEKIDFTGHTMQIKGDKKTYTMESAVRFVRVVGDEPDVAGLIGKVKTLPQLEELEAEHYDDSVIAGEVAYEVQNGFIARVRLPGDAEPPPEARAEGVETVTDEAPVSEAEAAAPAAEEAPTTAEEAAPPPAEGEAEGGATDEELLAQFLLDNLR